MEIAVQRFNTEYTFATLRSLNSIAEGEMKFDREKFNEKLEPAVSMWKRIYARFVQEQSINTKFVEKQFQMAQDDPVISFIMSEQNTRIDIIKKINDHFTCLEKVLNGSISLTNNNRKFAIDLMKDEIPDQLYELWPNGPEQPTKWMRAFANKMMGMKNWISNMKENKLYTARLTLGDFLYPEVYLNALRQKTCRFLN